MTRSYTFSLPKADFLTLCDPHIEPTHLLQSLSDTTSAELQTEFACTQAELEDFLATLAVVIQRPQHRLIATSSTATDNVDIHFLTSADHTVALAFDHPEVVDVLCTFPDEIAWSLSLILDTRPHLEPAFDDVTIPAALAEEFPDFASFFTGLPDIVELPQATAEALKAENLRHGRLILQHRTTQWHAPLMDFFWINLDGQLVTLNRDTEDGDFTLSVSSMTSLLEGIYSSLRHRGTQ